MAAPVLRPQHPLLYLAATIWSEWPGGEGSDEERERERARKLARERERERKLADELHSPYN